MEQEALKASNMAFPSLRLDLDFSGMGDRDQFVTPIFMALCGEFLEHRVRCGTFTRLIPLFRQRNGALIYQEEVCAPRRLIRDVMHLVNDTHASDDLQISKTLSRLAG